MNDRGVGIDPEVQFSIITFDQHFSIVEVESLLKMVCPRKKSWGGGDADFADLCEADGSLGVLGPCIRLADVEHHITVRLSPDIQTDVTIADRHGIGGRVSGCIPDHIIRFQKSRKIDIGSTQSA